MSTIRDDVRIDPRIKRVFGAVPTPVNPGDAASREQLIEEANCEEAEAMRERGDAFLERCDTEDVAPSAGLAITTRKPTSEPDGNIINIRLIQPDGDEPMPCVYYIHGGGMQSGSFLQGNYRAWGRIIAARGVAVAMVDFRNALTPSSVPEIGPFPAGLDDCVSGLKRVASNVKAELVPGSTPVSLRKLLVDRVDLIAGVVSCDRRVGGLPEQLVRVGQRAAVLGGGDLHPGRRVGHHRLVRSRSRSRFLAGGRRRRVGHGQDEPGQYRNP